MALHHRWATRELEMAHWGVALTLFQPLWPTRPTPADLARGRDEVTAARASPRFIDAAAAFFDNEGEPTYWS